VGVIDDGNQHFAGAVEAEGFLNQEAFTVVVAALELDLESLAENAQGVVIGVEGAVDHRGDYAFWVVVDQGLLKHGLAGAWFAQHQAQAALLGVNAEDVQNLLLVVQQREVLGVEGMALETEM
jgi:hypothetical protein